MLKHLTEAFARDVGEVRDPWIPLQSSESAGMFAGKNLDASEAERRVRATRRQPASLLKNRALAD